MAAIAAPTIVTALFISIRNNFRPGYYFLIAFSAYLFGSFLYILKTIGILPVVFITEYGQQIGSIIEVTLLSLGLGDRINYEKNQKLIAQKEVLENERIARRIQADALANIKKAENEVRELNKTLESRVLDRTEKLNLALEDVEEANTNILGSIRYSSLIQKSLLPDSAEIKSTIPESFFIWEPRDIIGGDIYYFEKLGKNFIIAVIDCTGHGAFMTMIASSGIRRIVNEDAVYSPAAILKNLNHLIKKSLQQDKGYTSSDDGLDASICFYDVTTDSLKFAGACQSLYYIEDGVLKVLKGDKSSIGYVSSNLDHSFKEHIIDNASDKFFYLPTDGYTDQLGGNKYRRLGSRAFKNIILDNYDAGCDAQKIILSGTLEKHRGENNRTDDITIAGFKPAKH